MARKPREMGLIRLLLVASSVSPVFLLFGFRGNAILEDYTWWLLCGSLFLLPNLLLWVRYEFVKQRNVTQSIFVTNTEDHRSHLISYLFTLLIPFFGADLNTIGDSIALGLLLCFVIFIFWHLNIHYINAFFAIAGYRIFTVKASMSRQLENGSADGIRTYAVLSKRDELKLNTRLIGYRLSGQVLIDRHE